jgi:hypothetical protein
MIVMVLFVALQGTAWSQGLLDSVFGPSGMGLWGTGPPNTFDSPQYYGGNSAPNGQTMQQPAYPQEYGSPQGYGNPQGYGYPQGQPGYGYPQQGNYPQWQGYQPPQAAPPQVQYSAPQSQASQPASQPVTVQVQPQAPAAVQQQQAAPVPADASPEFDPNLPAGAVKITTTTPEGTTIQYYPPSAQPVPQQSGVSPNAPNPRPAPARRLRASQAGTGQSRPASPSKRPSAIAMPKPVQIPHGQDPRAGWGPAVNRAPAAPGPR